MYQLERGFIQRWSHGRFRIKGARDGADMVAVFDGRVRVVEVRRAGNGVVKFEVNEAVSHFGGIGIGCDGQARTPSLAPPVALPHRNVSLLNVTSQRTPEPARKSPHPASPSPRPARQRPAPRPPTSVRSSASSHLLQPPVNGVAHPLATVLLECCGASAH